MDNDGKIVIGTEVETDGIDDGLEEIEEKVKKKTNIFSSLGKGLKQIGSALASMFSKVTSKVFDMALKLAKVFKGIGLTLAGLTLAGFIASFGIVLGQSEDLQSKLQQVGQIIVNCIEQLVMVFAPVVEKIVNFIYKMFVYLGYILNAWFGIDAFAKRTDKSIKSGVKGAKELRKQLAGFDEINVLNKDTGTSGIGGGGGLGAIDTSGIEIPKWVDDLAHAKDTIIEIAKWMAIAFATAKIIEFVSWISKLSGGLSVTKTLISNSSWVTWLGVLGGIALAVYGVVETVEAIVGWLNDPCWNTFNDVLNGLSITITGIGIALIAMNAASPVGWITTAIGVIGFLATSFADTKTEAEKLEQAQRDLADAQKAVNDAYNDFINAQKTQLNAYKNLQEAQKETTKTAKKLGLTDEELKDIGKQLSDELALGQITVDDLTASENKLVEQHGFTQKDLETLYESYLNLVGSETAYKKSVDDVTKSSQNYTEAQKAEAKQILDTQFQVFNATGKYDDLGTAMEEALNKGAVSSEELGDIMTHVLNQMDEDTRKTFVEGLPDNVKVAIATMDDMGIAMHRLTAKKYVVEFGLNTANTKQKLQEIIDKFNQIKTMSLKFTSSTSTKSAKGSILYGAKGLILPRLAVGGIINQPGRGVPLAGGGAIGGERGAEAVVPLTDSQQMALLGEAIGKYVNIKAEVPVYVGNRQIAREIRNINKKENFLYNGG